MEMLSERYGWTPAQIREMDVTDIEYYLMIIDQKKAISRAQAMRAK